ncbi:pilus assembly protein [Arsenicitalea aurantiaca]|uniref:Pilus assembly protein n=1 Tax=Arsenicitalea aurantiaca TaxID=1783274 RepID=A0A433X2H7_9HYPH|nr:pilus assembly protein N-terminal domain-containing protein [Arsenicitalea aurantiaca]RUT28192.1 pilus assembly protein [Arsenicitalea aurantiaca]
MPLKRHALALAILLPLGLPLFEAPAAMAQSMPISVKVNMARVLRVDAPASTVIIGNPGVADVTIQDPQTLVLTGKSYGQTNLIVLNDAGDPIADTTIQVIQAQTDIVTVFEGANRVSLSCAPSCAPMIMLGDTVPFTTDQVTSRTLVESIAPR